MLKLIKYEFMKKRVSLAIIYTFILCLTIYAAISIAGQDDFHFTLSVTFLSLLCIFAPLYLLLDSASSYGKELKEKYSYILFMTPHTPYTILGSKIIYTIGVTAITVALEFGIFTFLYSIFQNNYPISATLSAILSELGISIANGFLPIIATIISFISVLLLGYFSITLSNTILSNRKLNGLLTFVIFIALNWVINFITNKIPGITVNETTNWNTFSWVTIISSLIVIVIGYLGSSYLLDKKISL